MRCIFPLRIRERNMSRMTLGYYSWGHLWTLCQDHGPLIWYENVILLIYLFCIRTDLHIVGKRFWLNSLVMSKTLLRHFFLGLVKAVHILYNFCLFFDCMTQHKFCFCPFVVYVKMNSNMTNHLKVQFNLIVSFVSHFLLSMSLVFWRRVWICSKSALSTKTKEEWTTWTETTLFTSAGLCLPWWVWTDSK